MINMHMSRIVPFITGTVIPIISNSFRIEQIFRQDDELFHNCLKSLNFMMKSVPSNSS